MTRPLYVGVISGTSVDGLDLALLQIDDTLEFVAAATVPFTAELRAVLLALGQPGSDDVDTLGAADATLGLAIGSAVNDFLAQQGVTPQEVVAIGSHGQTVRHRPPGSSASQQPFTLQIGDPNRITELTGITTVADFRRRDLAAGGQGAPLVPPFHAALFRDPGRSRAVLNIGGISNLTLLASDPLAPVRGFDCGPGNALMDEWISRHQGRTYDADGAWAATGNQSPQLLRTLLTDPFLTLPPPKSTGREYYNMAWLEPLIEQSTASAVAPQDVQATLAEFTATSVIRALDTWGDGPRQLIVCGGGRRNGFVMRRLAALAPADLEVMPSESLGADGDALEAGLFAWLASRTLAGRPGNDAHVTGAAGPRVLGAIYPA